MLHFSSPHSPQFLSPHSSQLLPISHFIEKITKKKNKKTIMEVKSSTNNNSWKMINNNNNFSSNFLPLSPNSRGVGAAEGGEREMFHVLHKVPPGDGPYVRAKHAQLVEKDPEAAIVLFWKAINAGDRVDSALKDMAVVMKQLDRTEEAIEAVKSFRGLCSKNAQESLDNVLIDLYKKCGRVDEQIELLRQKLRMIYQGEAFNGKPTKTARSHGKKFQVSIKQETSRILGNLGWAYMQKNNYMAAEVVYKKAQMIDPDANKACNLGLCLIKQARYEDARIVLEEVHTGKVPGSEDIRTRNRAEELLLELESRQPPFMLSDLVGLELDDEFVNGLEQIGAQWAPIRPRRLPIFEQISNFKDQLAC